jgi:hypothetical protein
MSGYGEKAMTNPSNPNLNDPKKPDDENAPFDPDLRVSSVNTPGNLDDVERSGYAQTIAVLSVIIVAIVVVLAAYYYMYAPRTETVVVTTPAATTTQVTPMTTPPPPTTTTTTTTTTTGQ